MYNSTLVLWLLCMPKPGLLKDKFPSYTYVYTVYCKCICYRIRKYSMKCINTEKQLVKKLLHFALLHNLCCV